MKTIKTINIAISTLLVGTAAYAIDVAPIGQIQAQVNYLSDTDAASKWNISSPNSYIGVAASEAFSSGELLAFWRAGVDPVSINEQLALEHQQAYILWQQSSYGLWVGRLPTLEQSYIVDGALGLTGDAQKGLAVSDFFETSENKALRLEYSVDGRSIISGQIIIDEDQDNAEYSASYVLQTNEGMFSVAYRNPAEGDSVWSNLFKWSSDTASISLAWVYQDEIAAWDYSLGADLGGGWGFLGYGNNQDDEKRWLVGGQMEMSDNAAAYSEVTWWSKEKLWQWSTGVQISF